MELCSRLPLESGQTDQLVSCLGRCGTNPRNRGKVGPRGLTRTAPWVMALRASAGGFELHMWRIPFWEKRRQAISLSRTTEG